MKIGIATICTDEVKDYGKLFLEQLTPYAQRHGYGLHVESQKPDQDRHILLNKYVLLRSIIDDYDWVFWTDVDCYLESPQIRLESLLIPEAELIMSSDLGSVNAGHLLLRNCPRGKRFLDDMMAMKESTHRTVDQDMLCKYLQKNPRTLMWRLNGDVFNGDHTQSGRFFLRHLYGQPDSYRKAYHDPKPTTDALWLEEYFKGRRGTYLEVAYDRSLLDGLLKRGWRGVLNLQTDKKLQPWWEEYEGWGHFSAHPPDDFDLFDVVCVHSQALKIKECRNAMRAANVLVMAGQPDVLVMAGQPDQELVDMVSDMGFLRIAHRTPNALMLTRPLHD